MANNTVVQIGKMASTNVDSLLVSVKCPFVAQNGYHVVLGGLDANNDQVFMASTPVDVSLGEIVMIEAPVIVATGTDRLLIGEVDPRKFDIGINAVVRARRIEVGDNFKMTAEGFSTAPTVGQYAIPQVGNCKLAPSSGIGSTKISYKVLKLTSVSIGDIFQPAYELQAVKA